MEDSSIIKVETRLGEFWRGVQGVVPLLFGVFPFGMIFGALSMKAGLGVVPSQMMSSIVFAGSSQFMFTQMYSAATPGLVIILAVIVINLRHALYSVSIASYVKDLSKGWKALLAYLLTDEAFVTAAAHYEKEGVTPRSHWYFLGAGVGLWTIWQVSTFLGISLGTVIPSDWPLDFFLPLTFIAMVVPMLKDKATVGAALAAGVVAVVAFTLPYKLSIVLAAFVGIIAGLWLEKRS